jgi:hypothetical protein
MHEDIDPSATQIAGSHYIKYAIQPSEFLYRNKIGFLEGNAIKYAIRHRDKGGAEDIRKAIHYLQLILEWQYGQRTSDAGKTACVLKPETQALIDRQCGDCEE